MEHTERVIDGLHLVFMELPKFNPHTYSEKKMQVLWLRYLTEIDEYTRHVPAELLANPEVKKTLYNSGMRKGMQRGLQRGMQKGLERGRAEEKESVARNLKRMRLDSETISRATGLARDAVDRLCDGVQLHTRRTDMLKLYKKW